MSDIKVNEVPAEAAERLDEVRAKARSMLDALERVAADPVLAELPVSVIVHLPGPACPVSLEADRVADLGCADFLRLLSESSADACIGGGSHRGGCLQLDGVVTLDRPEEFDAIVALALARGVRRAGIPRIAQASMGFDIARRMMEGQGHDEEAVARFDAEVIVLALDRVVARQGGDAPCRRVTDALLERTARATRKVLLGWVTGEEDATAAFDARGETVLAKARAISHDHLGDAGGACALAHALGTYDALWKVSSTKCR